MIPSTTDDLIAELTAERDQARAELDVSRDFCWDWIEALRARVHELEQALGK